MRQALIVITRSVLWLRLLIVFSNSNMYVQSLYSVTEMRYASMTIFLISSRRLAPMTSVISGVWCRVGQYVRYIPSFPVHIHRMTQSIHILSFSPYICFLSTLSLGEKT